MSWSELPEGGVLSYCVVLWVRRYYHNWIFIITEAHTALKEAKIINLLHPHWGQTIIWKNNSRVL